MMGKAVIGIICFVLGGLAGVLLGGSLIGGAATGVGVATGLNAGICSTVIAAREEGLLTDEQVDQVLVRAARDMGADLAENSTDMVGSVSQCEDVMNKLKAASES